jgi:hypothetical protein
VFLCIHEKHISSKRIRIFDWKNNKYFTTLGSPGNFKSLPNFNRASLLYTHQYLEVIGQKSSKKRLVIYCRVSSAGQKRDLISQRNAVESFCLAQGKAIDLKLEDIVSGLNYKRIFYRSSIVFQAGCMVSENTRRKLWK